MQHQPMPAFYGQQPQFQQDVYGQPQQQYLPSEYPHHTAYNNFQAAPIFNTDAGHQMYHPQDNMPLHAQGYMAEPSPSYTNPHCQPQGLNTPQRDW
jgi:hypothetical protein